MQTLSDRDVLALTIWGEARGEPIEGKLAVGCVIRERLRQGRWGRTYTEVCRAPKQFSCWNSGSDNNHRALMERVDQIAHGQVVLDTALRECYWVADGILAQLAESHVRHATHYHAIRLRQAAPKWAETGKVVAELGSHRFYRDVA